MLVGLVGNARQIIGPRSTLREVVHGLALNTSLQWLIDVGDSASYAGAGQTVTDLSGNSISWVFGDSSGDATSDPSFSGVAGRQSSSEYLLGAVGYPTYERLTTAAATWSNTAHKDSAVYTYAGWHYTIDSAGLGSDYIYSADPVVSAPRIQLSSRSSGGGADEDKLTLIQYNGTTYQYVALSSGVIPYAQWCFLAASYTESTGAWTVQINATQTSGTQAYVSPSSVTATTRARINMASDPGGRFGGGAWWSRALSATELTSLYNNTKAKFGL